MKPYESKVWIHDMDEKRYLRTNLIQLGDGSYIISFIYKDDGYTSFHPVSEKIGIGLRELRTDDALQKMRRTIDYYYSR